LIRIGVTGGIGVGKSKVCQVLSSMSYPVFFSDTSAKNILATDVELIENVKQIFGEKAYIDGVMNRVFIAEQLFSDEDKKLKMNALVHPKVRTEFNSFCKHNYADFVFNEAALLFETGSYKDFDATILVTSPLELRITRTIERDKCTRDQVLARIENQWTDDQKKKYATFEIVNDNQQLIIPQIEAILEKLKNKVRIP
jgi:dephospho-CoA kinase